MKVFILNGLCLFLLQSDNLFINSILLKLEEFSINITGFPLSLLKKYPIIYLRQDSFLARVESHGAMVQCP